MVSRERILEAAARVYAKHGFRGATTRLIAIEAGVNEVTLFRTFGSKGVLLEAVLEHHQKGNALPPLPAEPKNPEQEVTEWVQTNLERIREMRPLLVHTMGEIEERPEAAKFACCGRTQVHDTITGYVQRLQARGMADPDADVDAAAVMLTGTVMSDAIARHFVPEVYPPIEEAAARYSRCFLLTVGAAVSKVARRAITPVHAS